jgi:hypothetical protein
VSDEFDQAFVVPDESEPRKELDSENKSDDEQKGL